MQLVLKILSGMANSVYPCVSALFVYAILLETLVYEILGHLPYALFRYGCVYSGFCGQVYAQT